MTNMCTHIHSIFAIYNLKINHVRDILKFHDTSETVLSIQHYLMGKQGKLLRTGVMYKYWWY